MQKTIVVLMLSTSLSKVNLCMVFLIAYILLFRRLIIFMCTVHSCVLVTSSSIIICICWWLYLISYYCFDRLTTYNIYMQSTTLLIHSPSVLMQSPTLFIHSPTMYAILNCVDSFANCVHAIPTSIESLPNFVHSFANCIAVSLAVSPSIFWLFLQPCNVHRMFKN